MAAELGSYKQAHTSSPPLTLGNSRVVEGPAPLKELGFQSPSYAWREKMICRILLLITLTSCVCALFQIHRGVEVPESQDEHFAGRVQFDKDVLREGRIRLHVSRLRTDDSGLYLCEVSTNYGISHDECQLSVSAATDRPKDETQKPTSRGPTSGCSRLGLTVVLLGCFTLCLL
ncbi:hypothetical protein L3Q82_016654 [Scortum barcoo]|uniref:Uncharacterized protein n=1 Tax=Scortum barcoo TaxID=214431 RepID=A0ACB8X7R4_9TELE|nr:hypothetical protein L3Q82_016654 [Scortum barcoo]